ncbi:hypothetical protein [Sinosporangium siamense]|uniref:Uncharacterized protein n=1 Tax=Sinosporangium siamense TaxID=1367973 RepID=A0A919RHL9_9ACTN|nr:hypothetical protein [Sinosporangium siamense]GII92004.1 hypothetical protein Ssi02_22350 [Sinosporangium siamense]
MDDEHPSGFMAFVNMTDTARFRPVDTMRLTRATWFLFGHLTSTTDGCGLTWRSTSRPPGGKNTTGGETPTIRLNRLRTTGARAGASIGGPHGTDPATTCETQSRLTAAYRNTLSRWNLTHLDFEPTAIPSPTTTRKRARAVATLQKEFRAQQRPLWVSFTLPLTSSGLTPSHRATLKATREAGARIDAVNLLIPLKSTGLQGTGHTIQRAVTHISTALALDETTTRHHLALTPVLTHSRDLTKSQAQTLASYTHRHHQPWLSLRGPTPPPTVLQTLSDQPD